MVDILISGLDEEVARRLKRKAEAEGASLNDAARAALRAYVRPSRAELAERARQIREMSPYSAIDSTDLIREDRDNDEPHR